MLKHLQRKPIGELEEGGAAVVIGTVREIDGVARISSPVSTTLCIGYHLDIRHALLDDKLRFVQLHDESRCVAFEVVDDTGMVRVDPDGLQLAITDSATVRRNPPHPPVLGMRLPPRFRGSPITIEEGLLMPGTRVLVCGVAARDPQATDYRDGKTVLVLRASATFPLVASSDADLFRQSDRPIAPEELHRSR